MSMRIRVTSHSITVYVTLFECTFLVIVQVVTDFLIGGFRETRMADFMVVSSIKTALLNLNVNIAADADILKAE